MKNRLYSKIVSALLFSSLLLILLVQSSCVKDVYHEDEKEILPEEKPTDGDFGFSVVTKCTLNINYDLKGQAIPFQVYYENPILDDNNTLNEAMMPKFTGWTDENGVYSQEFTLPTAMKSVYITTRAIGVPGCIIAEVESNQVNFNMSSPNTKAGLRATNTHAITPSMLVLGNWDEKGKPDYLIERDNNLVDLRNAINTTLPITKNVYETNPQLVDPSKIQVIRIMEEAEVNLLFITESASITNVLGYYHYPTGQSPKNIDEIKKIVAFPCANFPSRGALSCGDQMHLKYWDGQQFKDKFPANTTIEFFLMTASFSEGNINSPGWAPIHYTNPAFNVNGMLQSIALYDSNNKLVALGFEDKKYTNKTGKDASSDRDFNDVVFTIRTTPSSAIDGDGMPPLTPGEPLPEDNPYGQQGTLAFEDLWPNQGDYDMNDVVVHYNSTVHITKDNKVSKLDDEIAVKWNGGSILNGFGYQLGVPSSVIKSCNITTDASVVSPGLEGGQNLATIILFNNIRETVGSTFRVSTEFTTPQSQTVIEPPYNPFIIPGLGDRIRTKEVHLTNRKPTDLIDVSLLGTNNDMSDISLNKYYISKDNFPFAICLPTDFRIPKEGVRIDVAYPEFSEWAKSKGTTNQDWYLHSNPDNVYSVTGK